MIDEELKRGACMDPDIIRYTVYQDISSMYIYIYIYIYILY